MITRRGFLKAILAAAAAPAIVKASSIMRINPDRLIMPSGTYTWTRDVALNLTGLSDNELWAANTPDDEILADINYLITKIWHDPRYVVKPTKVYVHGVRHEMRTRKTEIDVAIGGRWTHMDDLRDPA